MKIGTKQQNQVANSAITSHVVSHSPLPPAVDVQVAEKEFDVTKVKDGNWFKRRYKKWKLGQMHRAVLVNMELRNGNWVTFVVLDKDGGFKYDGSYYRFDNEMKYYNISSRMWIYDYHQDFSIPLQRKIPISDIQKTVESSGITEVEYATNPATLERFTVAKIAEGIMRGQAIDDFLKQIRLLIIIGTVAAVIHLFLFMQKTGMLSSIKLPF
ncbi:MAG TPA: hypothetical protein VMV86_06310 [Methanosarcinales archaeon]|nr:hypothetical protein [Methanosarcinales archaeon]